MHGALALFCLSINSSNCWVKHTCDGVAKEHRPPRVYVTLMKRVTLTNEVFFPHRSLSRLYSQGCSCWRWPQVKGVFGMQGVHWQLTALWFAVSVFSFLHVFSCVLVCSKCCSKEHRLHTVDRSLTAVIVDPVEFQWIVLQNTPRLWPLCWKTLYINSQSL